MPKFMSYKEVAETCGVAQSTIWRWRKTEGFPDPIKIARNTTRFKAEDVEAWFEKRGGHD